MAKIPTRSRAGAKRTPIGRAGSPRSGVAVSPGRVHLYVGISLDGYVAAPDGGVSWLDPYADALAGFDPFIKTIGSIVMGRTTYDDAVARGHANFGDLPAYVVTHRPLAQSSSIIPYAGDLSALIDQIRRQHAKDIWLMGGGRLVRSFREADLIDVWSIAFVPTLLGAGLPMFPPTDFAERRLRLVNLRKYPSGVVELRYERDEGRP